MKEPNLEDLEIDEVETQKVKDLMGKNKTRITIYLDNQVIEYAKKKAEETGGSYQRLLNTYLKNYIQRESSENQQKLDDILHAIQKLSHQVEKKEENAKLA